MGEARPTAVRENHAQTPGLPLFPWKHHLLWWCQSYHLGNTQQKLWCETSVRVLPKHHFIPNPKTTQYKNWAATCDFQQCGILTSVDSDEPKQPPFKLRNSKWCSVNSLTVKKYLSDKQRLCSVCAYAQAGLSLCWSHIQHCRKSHVMVQLSEFWRLLLPV